LSNIELIVIKENEELRYVLEEIRKKLEEIREKIDEALGRVTPDL